MWCVCLIPTPKEVTTVSWAAMTCPSIEVLVICIGQIITCEPINIIYFWN